MSENAPGPQGESPLTYLPERESRPLASTSGTEGQWLCAWCHSHVASEADRFRYEGRDEFTFTNPEGIPFIILTFSRTIGCRETGLPTLQHTWFPGHAWSFCECGSCRRHLGWYYAGQHCFVGLIRDRIVRAVCVRN